MKKPFEKMLVFVDGSEESITAAQYAIVLSSATGAELTAFFVINTRALDDLLKSKIFLKSEYEEYKHDVESDADRYLNHVLSMAREKGVAIKTGKTSGTVLSEIKKKIEEENVDLLIIGELARIRSRRDEFYDEAERAMRSVSCPVLIVKNEDFVRELFDSL